MAQDAKSTRHNRTITVDFHNEATYFALLSDGKAFIEFVLAFFGPPVAQGQKLAVET
jgi:hypothetical protein